KSLIHCVAVVRMNDREGPRPIRRDHISQGDTGSVGDPLVEITRYSFWCRTPDQGRHCIDQLLKLPFAPPQRHFSVHLIIDIMAEAVPLDDASVLIPCGMRAA